MLLVVTNRADFTTDWLVLELEARGADFVRFNTEDYPTRVGLTWSPDGPGRLHLPEATVDLDQVDSVYYRRPLRPDLTAIYEPGRAQWAAQESRAALQGIWRTLEAELVNRPEANRKASSKPEQLRRALGLGFSVPASLVTNDPAQALDFARAHEQVIIKALDRGLVNTEAGERHYFTSSLDEAAIEDLTDIGPEPLYLQELIPKAHDVRVTVIGDSAYAARIESQNLAQAEIDWRRGPPGSVPHSAESLPKEVARLCVQLTQAYGLSFAAIDLVCRPQGDYVFLELNPNGQWAWVEQLTGLPLRARLADLLLGADG